MFIGGEDVGGAIGKTRTVNRTKKNKEREVEQN